MYSCYSDGWAFPRKYSACLSLVANSSVTGVNILHYFRSVSKGSNKPSFPHRRTMVKCVQHNQCHMPKKDTNLLNSVGLACDVLDALCELGSAGVTELADEIGCSKSTAHRQLRTLHSKEYLIKNDNQYQLGLKYIDMATRVRGQIDNYDVIRKEIESLAEETGETAQFATKEHGWVVYLYKTYGKNGVQTSSNVGTREYFHSTSLGKVMMAYMSNDRVSKIIDRHGLPVKTDRVVRRYLPY